MKNSNRFQISIPEPCSEDWNAMTPDAQGRFCGVCQKSIIDFTGKTPDEIARILSERLGQKVCGRFRKEQLTTTYRLEIPLKRYTAMRLSPVKVFTLALFVAFGASLFSCTDGKGERQRVEIAVSDSTEREIMGGVPLLPDTVSAAESPKEPKEVLGKIVPPKHHKKDNTKGHTKRKKDTEEVVLGGFCIPPKEK